jgi:hypothetical protein
MYVSYSIYYILPFKTPPRLLVHYMYMTASVVWWSKEFLATVPEVSGSIPDTTRFSEK